MIDEQTISAPETSRISDFKPRAESRICLEEPKEGNPYLSERTLWYGYDVFELMRSRDFVDVIFLLLKGELPSPEQKRLFENALVVLANPGPRHPATRAVMNAGASKTSPVNFLPIALSLMAGKHLGAREVDAAMRFLARNLRQDPHAVADTLLAKCSGLANDDLGAAGFGTRFGGRDPFVEKTAKYFAEEHDLCETVRWGQAFIAHIDDGKTGWLMTGLAAAVFLDLGFRPAIGAGILQLAACPGLLAHGIEMSSKPLTAMPFVADEDYYYEGPSHA